MRPVGPRFPYFLLALLAAIALPVQTLQTTGHLRHLLASGAGGAGTLQDRLLVAILGVATPLVCVALGFAVVAIRPRDRLAWILLGLLLAFGQMAGGQVAAPGLPQHVAIRALAACYRAFFEGSWPLFMLLFGVYFPHPPRQRWLGHGMAVVFGAPLAVFALASTTRVGLAAVGGTETALVLKTFLADSARIRVMLGYVAVTGFFFHLGYKAGWEREPDARRRLWLLYAGASASLTPLLLLIVTAALRRQPVETLPSTVLVPALVALFLFPATLAYVILVHRALDIRVVLRQGLQYALATRAILAVQIVLSFVLVFTATSLAADSSLNRPNKITLLAIGGVAVVMLRLGAVKVKSWTDRRFFRAAVDAEEILAKLGDEVRTIVETPALLAKVADTIAESLHVTRVAILLRDGDHYRVHQARGADIDSEAFVLAAAGPVASKLGASDDPVLTDLDDPRSWTQRAPDLGEERVMLAKFGAEVLLPLSIQDGLRGIVVLGPRRSEAPYTKRELRLLDSVASQTALALENGRLTAAVASEAAQRERMNREIEIAAEVQERLFPQRLPPIDGLDYAGHCRPARGIGGDYYDFLALPEGRLGIAIGDVSGKGIPAALLMATLQASLRGRLIAAPSDLASLMVSLNRQIFETSAHNRYATFFFAVFEPESRRLRYVNAGHNAPAVLRAGAPPIRLSGGGPVIGLLADASYREECVQLAPGDLVVAFTDGISEAMNAADEEWTEDRLIAAAITASTQSPRDLIATLVAGADAHAAGAPQFDDMTLVVARVG